MATWVSDYKRLTEELLQLFQTGDELLDVVALERMLTERDKLIDALRQRGASAEPTAEEREEWKAVQPLEQALRQRMQSAMFATRGKLQTVNEQKRGTNAYQEEAAFDSMFIDYRK